MKSVLYEKSKRFASRIVKMYAFLLKKGETVMSKQVLRSGTSIGANLAEAQFASSHSDFACKAAIALKECNETGYWLELLHDNGYLKQSDFRSIDDDCRELLAMLVATVKTSRKNKDN